MNISEDLYNYNLFETSCTVTERNKPSDLKTPFKTCESKLFNGF